MFTKRTKAGATEATLGSVAGSSSGAAKATVAKTARASTKAATATTATKKAAKLGSGLTEPDRPGVAYRDLLVRADELDKFSKDLLWLARHSAQCAINGAKPPPGLGLTDADLGVQGARLRAERSTARVSSKRSHEHHELLVLQSTLLEMARLLQARSKACVIEAGTGKGRPRGKEGLEGEVRAAFGIPPKKTERKAQGRQASLPISTERLNLIVALLQRETPTKTRHAACEEIAEHLLEKGNRLPSSAWRRTSEVKKEAARLEQRLSKYLAAKARSNMAT